MNHDYAHCSDFTDKCPKSCFRAQLERDLKARAAELSGMMVSYMSFRKTIVCPLWSSTCKNAGKDYDEVDQFVCDKCGIELQDWHRVERCEDGEVIFHEYTFRYCPNCGRKVMR